MLVSVARDIEKVLRSAIANAQTKDGFGGDVERSYPEALPILRALCFQHLCRHKTLYIGADELLVGSLRAEDRRRSRKRLAVVAVMRQIADRALDAVDTGQAGPRTPRWATRWWTTRM